VQDLVNLFMTILDDSLSPSPKPPTGKEGYYFCATDEYQWKELAAEVGKCLHAEGVITTPEPKPVTEEEELVIFGPWSGYAYASNCKCKNFEIMVTYLILNFFMCQARSRPGKAYALGWKPIHHTRGLFESIKAEYDAVVEEGLHQGPKVHFDEMYNLSGTK